MEPTRLKLGKGAAFVKTHLRRLRQEDETWQADFRALPKPPMQTETHYIGFVVTDPDQILVADLYVEGTPTVNDLSTLLARSMKRPSTGDRHRPRRILFRKNPRWRELFSHLDELGIEVAVHDDLPRIDEEYDEYVRLMIKTSAKGTVPSSEQAAVEAAFPAVARWVQGYGHIEIGDQEGFGFTVRALDYGGLVFEEKSSATLAEAMAALEVGLSDWFETQEGQPVTAKSTGRARKRR